MSQNIDQREKAYRFLKNGGEMSEIVLSYDWSASALGPIPKWPQSLLSTLGNILHSPFPMFLFWGTDLTCFYNDAYRPSLGIDGKHPAIGKSGEAVRTEIWDFIAPIIHQVLTTGVPAWYEDQLLPIFRNNKIEDVYWTFSYSPAYGDDGEIAGVVVTCMETTAVVLARKKIESVVSQRTGELEQAQASLLQANLYLQNIINLFKEPLQILEPIFENGEIINFRYKLTNAAYAAYANTTPENLQHKIVSEVFPGYVKTSSFSKVAETYRTGHPDTWEIHYNQDGLDLYNQMSATKLDQEVIVHFTDFTKMKQLQFQLLGKIEELEHSNKNLEEFAHVASHDLKEPIRKIQIYTDELRRRLSDRLAKTENAILAKIEDGAERMRVLIEDLLLYSQVSQVPLEKEEVDLNVILTRVAEDLEITIRQTNAKVIIEPLPIVEGYSWQLQQMFQNLVSNSLKYCRKNVPVEIMVTTINDNHGEKQYDVVELRDNGIGFEQKFADKIFQLFARLHSKDEYSGTGIGLSIVKKVIDNHQAHITAEGEVDRGAVFKIYFPRKR